MVTKTGALFSHGKISRNLNSECRILTALKICIDLTVPNLCSYLFYFFPFFYVKKLTTQTQNISTQFLQNMDFCPTTRFFGASFAHHRMTPLYCSKTYESFWIDHNLELLAISRFNIYSRNFYKTDFRRVVWKHFLRRFSK